MDGENNGKPYEQMDDLGAHHYFWKHPYDDTKRIPLDFCGFLQCYNVHVCYPLVT